MITSTSRSRLYELRRERVSARRAADLLERKREVLLRETTRRAARLEAMRSALGRDRRAAAALLRVAQVEIGSRSVAAAGLAQSLTAEIAKRVTAVMGVRIDELRASARPYRAVYGAASTRASLDAAGAAFTALLPRAIELAAEEGAVSRLRVALRKVTKVVNALQKVILPHLERQIRLTVESIDEEERDEAVRRKILMAVRASPRHGDLRPRQASTRNPS